MRVLHLSSSDMAGGAARAAYRLHRALVAEGVDSRMLVRSKRSFDDRVTSLGYPSGFWAKVGVRRVDGATRRSAKPYDRRRPNGYDPFSDDRCGLGRFLARSLPECDVLHLHWVKGLVDYRELFIGLKPRIRVVWTLHDMNPFTGGCHYDHECGRFQAGCGACPQLGSGDAGDLSALVFDRKRSAYAAIPDSQLQVVTPSRWLGDVARRSALMGRFEVTAIPNGIDTEAFAPRDRIVARRTLGLPPDAKVLAFVAHGLDGRRKGFDLLREALSRLNQIDGLWLLSAGGMHRLTDVAVPHLCLGSVDNERLLSLVYSAADATVVPSIQDNLPNTVIESFACGTPVIGFDTGGVPDMVAPGQTGWLTPLGDVDGLANSITELIANTEAYADMADTCRRVAVERYDLSVQSAAYRRLYRGLMANVEPADPNSEATLPGRLTLES